MQEISRSLTARGPGKAPQTPDPRALAAAGPAERLRLLGSSPEGLDSSEAAARLARFGPNEPGRQVSSDPLRAFASQFGHTLALLLWFAAGLAFAAGIPELGGAIVAVVAIRRHGARGGVGGGRSH